MIYLVGVGEWLGWCLVVLMVIGTIVSVVSIKHQVSSGVRLMRVLKSDGYMLIPPFSIVIGINYCYILLIMFYRAYKRKQRKK